MAVLLQATIDYTVAASRPLATIGPAGYRAVMVGLTPEVGSALQAVP